MADLWSTHDPAELLTAVDIDDLIDRPSWMADAACREHPDVPFVPELGQTAAPAKAICAGCLVRPQCLAYALVDAALVGIWGGTSPRERAAIRAGRAA